MRRCCNLECPWAELCRALIVEIALASVLCVVPLVAFEKWWCLLPSFCVASLPFGCFSRASGHLWLISPLISAPCYWKAARVPTPVRYAARGFPVLRKYPLPPRVNIKHLSCVSNTETVPWRKASFEQSGTCDGFKVIGLWCACLCHWFYGNVCICEV